MTEPFELLSIGEPLLEYNSSAPPGSGQRERFTPHFGGDTSTVAIAAARQGARAAYISAVGADSAGDALMALWQREGVGTGFVRRSSAQPTGIYFVSHDEAGHHFSYYRSGSAASAYGTAELPRAAIGVARVLHASGISLGISNSAADAVLEAIDVARAGGAQVSFDTNYRPRLWPPRRAAGVIHEAVRGADIAFPGLDDAAALTGLADPDAVADFYLRLGPRLVVLKMGSQGALLATPDHRLRVAPHACSPVDATGAGDVFCGSFLARCIAGDPPEAAVRYAGCAAALSTMGFGAVGPIPRADAVWAALAPA
ncbi:sugar kinase [Lichenicoccus sp.]|uniref:sugar kinase n=1 Tax=Lichenicoccus sp. TaxID=2781899 RepID=UPI003D0A0DC0